ncbi:hypothetical protein HAX54_046462, partial [Datura stramonium]|nr:hypothetical protein [Datura stramonium]
ISNGFECHHAYVKGRGVTPLQGYLCMFEVNSLSRRKPWPKPTAGSMSFMISLCVKSRSLRPLSRKEKKFVERADQAEYEVSRLLTQLKESDVEATTVKAEERTLSK